MQRNPNPSPNGELRCGQCKHWLPKELFQRPEHDERPGPFKVCTKCRKRSREHMRKKMGWQKGSQTTYTWPSGPPAVDAYTNFTAVVHGSQRARVSAFFDQLMEEDRIMRRNSQ